MHSLLKTDKTHNLNKFKTVFLFSVGITLTCYGSNLFEYSCACVKIYLYTCIYACSWICFVIENRKFIRLTSLVIF